MEVLTPEELELKRQELEEKRRLKRRRRKLRLVYYGIIIIIAIILAVGTAYYTYNKGMGFSYHIDRDPVDPNVQRTQRDLAERVNVLIMGIDGGPHDSRRTDTMILASVDPTKGQVALISIPRDTRVQIPGRKGYDRVNAAHAYGGPRLAMNTVSQFLGVPVRYYVKVDFEGFERLVDILGGVEIDVERRMKYDDFAQDLHIDLYPGLQRLSGSDALGYVRFRADGLGDISLLDPAKGEYGGRIHRQQKFMQAFAKEALKPSTIAKLPALSLQLWDCVATNLSLTRMINLGLAMRDITSDSVVTALVPGRGEIIGGVSYWVANSDATQVMVDRLIWGVEPVTIQVLNGSGAAGAAGYAAARLREQGYQVVDVRDAHRFGYRETEVIVNPARRDVGTQIAELFGAKIIDDDGSNTVAWGDNGYDVMVIVGENFSVPQF